MDVTVGRRLAHAAYRISTASWAIRRAVSRSGNVQKTTQTPSDIVLLNGENDRGSHLPSAVLDGNSETSVPYDKIRRCESGAGQSHQSLREQLHEAFRDK